MPKPRYYIGVDIGGTFTDCAVLGPQGDIATIAKVPSTPEDPSEGVLRVLKEAAQALDTTVETLLVETDLLVHGCTVATNAMIERKGARTGLITTRGHEDVIFIGRVLQKRAGLAERELLHQSKLDKADPPVITPLQVRGVSERIDSESDVVVPLNLHELDEALRELGEQQEVEALAVTFLWSFANSSHELAAKEMIAQRFPGIFTAVSHEVAPLLGEYERTVTTLLTAYLGPAVGAYLQQLEDQLQAHNLQRPMLVMQARGGLTTVADAKARPLLTLDSGPVGGTLGAGFFGKLLEEPNIIATDMGGTSFDVSLLHDYDFELDEEPVVEKYTFFGPKVAISSIGAGGGSIVWLDPDGVPRVGPRSAGAAPGPACYDAGGAEPTVTDVDLVLGYLNPDYFLGGRKPLNRQRAEEALAHLARQAGMSGLELATGAFKIVNSQMADLITKLTVEAGHDPRRFTLFAYGGAGPTHAAFFARELKIKSIYVPSHSPVFSALGMLTGDIVHTYEGYLPLKTPLAEVELEKVNRMYQGLEEKVHRQFADEGKNASQTVLSRVMYMKYRYQFHSLTVDVPTRWLDAEDIEAIERKFETKYEDVYGLGTGYRQAGIEIVKYRVDGHCATVAPQLARSDGHVGEDPAAALKGERAVYFDVAGDFMTTPVYDGALLRPSFLMTGPSIIERMGDTVVIPPGAQGKVDGFFNIRIDVPS